MFEMYKYVLDKVSFDQFLFRKELKKAIKEIDTDEQKVFKSWCFSTFDHRYKDVLYEVFDSQAVSA